jgi:hypothetical protein
MGIGSVKTTINTSSPPFWDNGEYLFHSKPGKLIKK